MKSANIWVPTTFKLVSNYSTKGTHMKQLIAFINKLLARTQVDSTGTQTTYHIPCVLKCEVCSEDAKYRAVSVYGRWGCFCGYHWRTHTPAKLGLGMGQKFIR